MVTNQPEPGAQLQDGEASAPRPAATVILLRGGAERLELLLVRRNPKARFMGGAWVFPGGSVDTADGEGEVGLRAAAARELSEETGIDLPAGTELVAFARWITPETMTTRYDTWFYLACAPAGSEPKIDGAEIVDAIWVTPARALEQQAAGELSMVFPTIKQLQQLAAFESARALLSHARGRPVETVQPLVMGSGESARIPLPDDPGYS
jgi:8-oxo-dGTP pyrophosphatase MutT (NUDIX family)